MTVDVAALAAIVAAGHAPSAMVAVPVSFLTEVLPLVQAAARQEQPSPPLVIDGAAS